MNQSPIAAESREKWPPRPRPYIRTIAESYSEEQPGPFEKIKSFFDLAQDCDNDGICDHKVTFVKGWRNVFMGRAWKNNGCGCC